MTCGVVISNIVLSGTVCCSLEAEATSDDANAKSFQSHKTIVNQEIITTIVSLNILLREQRQQTLISASLYGYSRHDAEATHQH